MLTSIIVSTLFYRQSSGANDAVTTAARVAYQLLSTGIHQSASIVICFKQSVSKERTKCAHPYVSQQYLDRFLDDLGARSLDLSDLECWLFHYLWTMSTTPANIQGTKWSWAVSISATFEHFLPDSINYTYIIYWKQSVPSRYLTFTSLLTCWSF